MAPRSAAQTIWGNLPSGVRPEVKQSERSLGDALWPQLSRAAKRADADQRLWDEILRRQRDNFLRGWREERGR
jgi:hypothetical protein